MSSLFQTLTPTLPFLPKGFALCHQSFFLNFIFYVLAKIHVIWKDWIPHEGMDINQLYRYK